MQYSDKKEDPSLRITRKFVKQVTINTMNNCSKIYGLMDSAIFCSYTGRFSSRYTCPFAARIRLLRLTDTQIWALRAPAHRSCTAPLHIHTKIPPRLMTGRENPRKFPVWEKICGSVSASPQVAVWHCESQCNYVRLHSD